MQVGKWVQKQKAKMTLEQSKQEACTPTHLNCFLEHVVSLSRRGSFASGTSLSCLRKRSVAPGPGYLTNRLL